MIQSLYINWNVDPEIFSVGCISIRWYSLLFVLGFVLGWYIFRWFFRTEKIKETLLDPLLYTLIAGTIIGARLGHCIFYQPEYYFGSWKGFWEIFMPWKGGLASHGGTIALLLAMWWFAKKYGPRYRFDFLWLLDHLAIPVAFAAFFIRLGNLFNSEIFGAPTTLPWGFYFPFSYEGQDGLPHHPTQLYEGLTYLLLGIVLILLYKYKREKLYRGTVIGIFFVVVFGARFLIEFVKNDQVAFEANMALNMGQILSIPFIILGIALMIYGFVRKEPFMTYDPKTRPVKKKA